MKKVILILLNFCKKVISEKVSEMISSNTRRIRKVVFDDGTKSSDVKISMRKVKKKSAILLNLKTI
jgi:hypothetical protein